MTDRLVCLLLFSSSYLSSPRDVVYFLGGNLSQNRHTTTFSSLAWNYGGRSQLSQFKYRCDLNFLPTLTFVCIPPEYELRGCVPGEFPLSLSHIILSSSSPPSSEHCSTSSSSSSYTENSLLCHSMYALSSWFSIPLVTFLVSSAPAFYTIHNNYYPSCVILYSVNVPDIVQENALWLALWRTKKELETVIENGAREEALRV